MSDFISFPTDRYKDIIVTGRGSHGSVFRVHKPDARGVYRVFNVGMWDAGRELAEYWSAPLDRSSLEVGSLVMQKDGSVKVFVGTEQYTKRNGDYSRRPRLVATVAKPFAEQDLQRSMRVLNAWFHPTRTFLVPRGKKR